MDRRFYATSTTHAFERACRKSGVSHATIHNRRHTFVANARRGGIDYVRIIATTRHKTMAVFRRNNAIDQRDLQGAICRSDTYPDTLDVRTSKAAAHSIDNSGMGR